jgi:1-deoxy-D-xylulose-5-phosphate synthase
MSLNYKLLSQINSPSDIKSMNLDQLNQLAEEMRQYTIESVKNTGGHLAPTLGVIELTIAMHYVFDTPSDKFIWDVGHQAYAHKILTGRREELKHIRQYGGISGFCKRTESEHDAYGAGHASTSISAGVGFAVARDLKGEKNHVISVIGDGALTGGLAYEAMNNLGILRTKMIVILNDNKMSISPNVGAMSKYLNKIVTNPLYNRVRDEVWRATGALPFGKSKIRFGIKKLEESLKSLLVPGILFDEMGLRYFGPIDGHDIGALIDVFKNVKNIQTPILLHVQTKKGKGLKSAEEDPTGFHGIGPMKKGHAKPTNAAPPYLEVFGETLIELAKNNDNIVGITAAMREGTGLVEFEKQFPKRYFDVGIAEGHAVTFAGSLAADGLKPFVAIYSTFLQRAYDHIIHDVVLQKLPVVFAIDRAGLVGEDGPTHHGTFDLSYISIVPEVVVTAPKDGDELRFMLHLAASYQDGPFFIRYPKASSRNYNPELPIKDIRIGEWESVSKGKKIAIIATGSMVGVALDSQKMLGENKVNPTIINARFIKPIDQNMLNILFKEYSQLLVIEENTYFGGLGELIQALAHQKEFKGKVHSLALPDRFVTHGARDLLLDEVKLTPEHITKYILEEIK